MVEDDENNVEDTRAHEKSGVQLAWLGWEDLVWEKLRTRSGLVPAVLGMVTWLTHKIL